MPAPTTLSPGEIDHFHTHGYLVVRAAFAAEDARVMRDEWWAEMAEVRGVIRKDRSTWKPFLGDLKRPKTAPSQAAILTDKVRGVIDDLLGPNAWAAPRDWGRALVTLPGEGDWDIPTGLWHWDTPSAMYAERLMALFVVSFIGEVAPRGGGTLVLSGSHRLLQRHEAALTGAERRLSFAARRDLFLRSDPYLMALAGKAASPPDRIAAFMARPSDLDGVSVQVVELTGAPGDMVFCHPAIVHCVAPNRGTEPRFMRIKPHLLTHEGQALVRGR